MDTIELQRRFAHLTTAHLTDGCVRTGVPVSCGPSGLHAVLPGSRLAGRALPARHVGSVDVFLEAFGAAEPGDVLVVDNGGRLDESCVGDLVALEAREAGLGGIVIWGLNRDSREIREIGLPVFSLGTLSTGPLSVGDRPADALAAARVGEWSVTRDDLVFADDDGVIFVPADRADEVFAHAEGIRDTELAQADRIRAGVSLREQVSFARYLERRASDPSYGFRQHLRDVGGAIEV